MKELVSFNETKMWKSFPVGQKKTDNVLEAIVANAKQYKMLMETAEPQHHVFRFNARKKKQGDVRNSLQLQYFNMAPSYVTRKRKSECDSVLFGPPSMLPTPFSKTCTSTRLDTIIEEPTMILDEEKGSDNEILKQNKATTVSPIPAFIAKDLPPKEACLFVSPSSTSLGRLEESAVELLKTVNKVQEIEGTVQYANCYSENEEEPVKNSMFWLYRSFPHIA